MPRHLLHTIAHEVLPRLLEAHNGAPPGTATATPAPQARDITEETVRRLSALCLEPDGGPAAAYVLTLRDQGHRLDVLCLQLLAPTARRLGQMWNDDTCSFMDVTLALGRLQQILTGLGGSDHERRHHSRRPRAMLAPCSGEQHTFGVQMVTEFFRRDGWDVRSCGCSARSALTAMAQQQRFDVIGLSAGTEQTVDALVRDIRALRRACGRHPVVILVGGSIFCQYPDLVHLVGADAMARDAQQGPAHARQLVALAEPA